MGRWVIKFRRCKVVDWYSHRTIRTCISDWQTKSWLLNLFLIGWIGLHYTGIMSKVGSNYYEIQTDEVWVKKSLDYVLKISINVQVLFGCTDLGVWLLFEIMLEDWGCNVSWLCFRWYPELITLRIKFLL